VANYTATRIRKHNFSSDSVRKGDPPYVIGFDSEADTSSDGRPMLFQWSLPDTTESSVILQVVPETRHAGLGCFLDFLDRYTTTPEVEYLVYGYNVQYELTQLFHDLPKEVVNESEWTLRSIRRNQAACWPWQIRVSNDKRQIVEFVHDGGARVQFLDAAAFYKGGLDKVAKMLGVGQKYVVASGSDDRSHCTRRSLLDREFILYAKRDAYVTRLIGEHIQDQHRAFGIRTCISAPHFAATVYRTHFLRSRPVGLDTTIEQAGLYSYHGGKNGFYLDGPEEFPTIYNYDITSAYPEAMRQLPDVENSSWKGVKDYEPGQHGIYNVELDYTACRYRGLQTHEGSWARSGRVQFWTTSYELDAVLQKGEAKLVSCNGYILLGPSGGSLAAYVDRFFAVKSTTTGPERETAKLLLNSLYGKFFQKQPTGRVGNYDLDSESWIGYDAGNELYDYEAGGLYNPPVASLITGFVRAKIHNLEHQYESVMTSTDGFFGTNPPILRDIGKALGQLSVQRGRLRIWRERLYIFDPIDGDTKFALHGFHGHKRRPSCEQEHCSIGHIDDIPLRPGEYQYYGRQMITLKMSTRDQRAEKHSPGEFVNMLFTLRI
jgi:hypothetical protein